MRDTLEVLNKFEQQGVYERYAIGGAMAAVYYTEPFETEDLDVFVLLHSVHTLAQLENIYAVARKEGHYIDGPYVIINDVPVQFLPAYNPLIEEAVTTAQQVDYEGIVTRIPCVEYLLAIMLQTGRPKDMARFAMVREQASINNTRLLNILRQHSLEEKYYQWTS